MGGLWEEVTDTLNWTWCPCPWHHPLHSLVLCGEETPTQLTSNSSQAAEKPKRQSFAGPFGFLYPEDSSMLNINITKGSTWFFKSLGTHGSPYLPWAGTANKENESLAAAPFILLTFKWCHEFLYQGYLSLLPIIPQLILPTLKIIMYLIVRRVWRTQGFI